MPKESETIEFKKSTAEVKVEAKKIQGKDCVAVEFDGPYRPYFAYGRAYMRVGEPDKQLSIQEMEDQFIRLQRWFHVIRA